MRFQLEENETLHVAVDTEPDAFALTSHRVIVGSEQRTALDLPIAAIRRVQLDIEVGRPATLVFVPHEPQHPPQVLAVPHDALEGTTRAVYLLGDRLRSVSA